MRRSKLQKQKIQNFLVYRMRFFVYIIQNLINLVEILIGWVDKWRFCDSVKLISVIRILKISIKNLLYDYCDVFFFLFDCFKYCFLYFLGMRIVDLIFF